jgi:uncharacterized protein YecA (UPF0149 family)
MKYPGALDLVGFATESGVDRARRSEEAFYFDTRQWSAEDEELARTYQHDLNILVAERATAKHVLEYPVLRSVDGRRNLPKNPRNKPCPCGSGRKYKSCHGS